MYRSRMLRDAYKDQQVIIRVRWTWGTYATFYVDRPQSPRYGVDYLARNLSRSPLVEGVTMDDGFVYNVSHYSGEGPGTIVRAPVPLEDKEY